MFIPNKPILCPQSVSLLVIKASTCVSKPVSQSVNPAQSVRESFAHSLDLSGRSFVSQSVSQSVTSAVNKSVSQSDCQSFSQTFSQPSESQSVSLKQSVSLSSISGKLFTFKHQYRTISKRISYQVNSPIVL